MLRTLRNKHGLTQTQMAKRLCVAQGTYSKLENNVLDLSVGVLVNLKKEFRINIDKMLTERICSSEGDVYMYRIGQAIIHHVKPLDLTATTYTVGYISVDNRTIESDLALGLLVKVGEL